MIRKIGDKWRVDVQPGGRSGRRVRRTFSTRAEAQRFERFVLSQYREGQPWGSGDRVRLSLLVEQWGEIVAPSLRSGLDRLAQLRRLCRRLGDPTLGCLRRSFVDYRVANPAGVSRATLNLDLAHLRSLVNWAAAEGRIPHNGYLKGVRRLPVDRVELVALHDYQIDRLLTVADRHQSDVGAVIRVCLATGARWSEAECLTDRDIGPEGVTFRRTKNGRPRTVPVDGCVRRLLESRGPGRLFRGCYGVFGRVIREAGLELPKGQRSHVLRHTFASRFLAAGGNIRVLQAILDHQSLETTMRYAHFLPDHLAQAVEFNPLSNR